MIIPYWSLTTNKWSPTHNHTLLVIINDPLHNSPLSINGLSPGDASQAPGWLSWTFSGAMMPARPRPAPCCCRRPRHGRRGWKRPVSRQVRCNMGIVGKNKATHSYTLGSSWDHDFSLQTLGASDRSWTFRPLWARFFRRNAGNLLMVRFCPCFLGILGIVDQCNALENDYCVSSYTWDNWAVSLIFLPDKPWRSRRNLTILGVDGPTSYPWDQNLLSTQRNHLCKQTYLVSRPSRVLFL